MISKFRLFNCGLELRAGGFPHTNRTDPFTHVQRVKPPLAADGSDSLPLGDVDATSRLTDVQPGVDGRECELFIPPPPAAS